MKVKVYLTIESEVTAKEVIQTYMHFNTADVYFFQVPLYDIENLPDHEETN